MGSDIEAGKYRFYNGSEELATALTSVQRSEGELVGHTPDSVMALYMTDKHLESGDLSSSRSSLRDAGRDEETVEREREKREALRESEVGRAILDANQSGPYG